MSELRVRLLILTDRALAVLMAVVLFGTALAFGGAVWWARPAIAALTLLLVLALLVRILLEGTWRLLKSPLTFLGMLGLLLAVAQLVPLPAPLASRISARSRSLHTLGVQTDRALADDPSLTPPEPGDSRSPATVDRSATLRWLAGGLVCLALFGVAAHFADRLGNLVVIWGSVVAALFVNTIVGLVQLVGRVPGLFGFIKPGKGPAWAPSLNDLLATPNMTLLRVLNDPAGPPSPWATPRPDEPFLIGSLMGGPGAYLALASLGLPLALALTLHALAPRGSREDVWTRLKHSGRAGLVAFLVALTLASAALTGLIAGPFLVLPFGVGLILAGLPTARASGLRWVAVALTIGAVFSLGLGLTLGETIGRPPIGHPLAGPGGWESARRVWVDSARIARDFPVLGSGLGSFASIYPFYKSQDQATTTALSSGLQWGVEAGLAGLAIVVLGGGWCVFRLPEAVRRVGTADRALAFGLIGTAVCFASFSMIHWSVELAAIAIAASALGGTANRWLAGGTDLFVERA